MRCREGLRLVRLENLVRELEELVESGEVPTFEFTEPRDYPRIGREELEDLL